MCARCRQPFYLKFPLEPYDLEACYYHYGVFRIKIMDGQKVRAFSCCEGELGAKGCSQGPHVYKLEDFEDLHAKVVFFSFSNMNQGSMSNKIVAIDSFYRTPSA